MPSVHAQIVQARLLADSTHFVIGDPLHLRVVVNTPLGTDVQFPSLDSVLVKNNIELLGQDAATVNPRDQKEAHVLHFRVTAWDEDEYEIPSFPIEYQINQQRQYTYTQALTLFAIYPPQVTGDSTYVAPIKPLLVEEATFWDYLRRGVNWWLVGGILGALIIASAIYLFLRYRKKQVLQKAQNPADIARRRLKELAEKKYIEKKQYKAYHSAISFIIRDYLQHRFALPARPIPHKEWLDKVKPHQVPSDLQSTLSEVLETADLVKFAKATPLQSANTLAFSFTEQLIQRTEDAAQ